MTSGLDVFALSIAVGSRQGPLAIERGVWGSIVEPLAERAGTWRFSGDGVVVELTRFDRLYGYLRVLVGGCRVEGVLLYRQKHVEFRPQVVEGCDGVKGELVGVSVLEED